jgi:hypothetical protein
MPKLKCLCGNDINLSPVPNDNGYRILWEPRIEVLLEDVLALFETKDSVQDFEKALHDALFRTKPTPPQMYECEKCGRLAIFAHPSDAKPICWYHPERTADTAFTSLHKLISAP